MSKVYDFSLLRPTPSYPVYPCYHQGKYLEDYFFDFYIKNKEQFDAKGRTLIPVSWTTLYVENTPIDIQDYIDQLDPNGAYFTVVQHDDGVRQRLPANTLVFEAGGLGNGIPIPLVCSPLPNVQMNDYRPIFCSFVGSLTHPLRKSLYNIYGDLGYGFPPYEFSVQQWTQNVNTDKLKEFVDITNRSIFAFAPRGYGATSFRLYEIMQLGAIPVYVSDKHWLPWQDELNWSDFCVIINADQIWDINKILINIANDGTKLSQMRNKVKEIYNDYFSLEGVCKQILKRL